MWLDKENNEDPYNNGANATGKSVNTPGQANIGSGAGGGAPVGSGQGSQTNVTPAGNNPVSTAPQQKPATVQDYLGANKEQGNQLGQQFQSNLNAVGAKDTKAIDDAASSVKNQVQAGTTAYDPNVVNKAVSDPTKVANDPGQLQSFLKQWNASYTGPSSFEGTDDYTKANSAATDAQTHATEVGDAGGRKQILQDDYGVYGQGNKGLDQTLLQNSDNFGKVLDTGKQLSSLPDYLAGKATDVNTAATKAADDTAAAKKNTQDLFANSLTNFQTGLNNKVTADQQQATSTVNQVKADLASGDASKVMADLNKSDLSPSDRMTIFSYLDQMNKDYGAKPDLTNFYTYNPATDINPASAASKDDFAKAAALQKLTGVDYSGVLNPADVSKAGSWNNVSTGFQTPSIKNYLQGGLKQLDTELLGKTNLGDVFAKMNLPNILNTKAAADQGTGTQAAQQLIAAAQRLGVKGGGSNPNNLDQLAHQAEVALNSAGANNPTVAGLKAFVNLMNAYIGVTRRY